MKRSLAALLSALILLSCGLGQAWAANAADLMATVQALVLAPGDVKETKVAIDTTGTDLVVHTPASGYSVYLKGVFGIEGSASNLSWKQRSPALTGTVSQTNGSATITGSGTAFETDYAAGDEIVIAGGSTLIVQSVGSDTSITATSTASGSVSGAAHRKQQTLVTTEQAANQGYLVKNERDGWVLATASGYALVVNASVAISSLLLLTQEGKQ